MDVNLGPQKLSITEMPFQELSVHPSVFLLFTETGSRESGAKFPSPHFRPQEEEELVLCWILHEPFFLKSLSLTVRDVFMLQLVPFGMRRKGAARFDLQMRQSFSRASSPLAAAF